MFARRAAALLLAAVLLVGAIPAAFAEEEGTPEGEAVTEAVYTVPTTIGRIPPCSRRRRKTA